MKNDRLWFVIQILLCSCIVFMCIIERELIMLVIALFMTIFSGYALYSTNNKTVRDFFYNVDCLLINS